MLERASRYITLHPRGVMSVLLALTAIGAVSALRTRFEFAPQALFGGNDRLVEELQRFKETFAYEDSVIMVIVEATGASDVLDRRVLNWQADFVRQVKTIPGIVEAASLATIEVPGRTLTFPPTLVARPFIHEFPADEYDEERVRDFVDRSPLLTGTMISEDRRVGAALVFVDPDVRDIDELATLIEHVRSTLREVPPPEGFQPSLTGLPILRVGTVVSLQADQRRLLPMAAVVYLVTLTLFFRRLAGALLPLLAVGMGLAWTMGTAAALDVPFNLVTNILPVLLLVVGVSNCVHVLDEFTEQTVAYGGDTLMAAQGTVRYMGRSSFLTLFTAAVGFGSLLTARSQALRQFAWEASLGMAFMYIAILGTCGALLRYFHPRPREQGGTPLGRFVGSLGRAVNRYPRMVMFVSAVLFFGSLWIGRDVPANSYMIETYDKSHPALVAFRLAEEKLSGLLPLEIHLEADHSDRLLSPDIIRKIDSFQERAMKQPEVLFARSYVDILEGVSRGMPGNEHAGLPASDEALETDVQRGLYVVRRVGETLGFPAFMSEDRRQGRILIKLRDAGTLTLQHVMQDLAADLTRTFPPDSGVRFQLTGDAYVSTMAMNNIIRDMYYSLLTASLTIFITIAALFRSPRIGLITAIPNLTPLAITLGYIGLRGYDMNVANVIVFTISLGIACDDSIHFLYRFRDELKHTGDMQQAIDRTFAGTGRAIVVSSTLLVSGLSVLFFSSFVPTRRFAELTTVTMAASLVGILWLLPACISLFWKRPPAAATVAAEAHPHPPATT